MPNERYHYRECGLDDVYLLNGFRYDETPHGRVVHIEEIDDLHRAIGEFLIFERKKLTGSEFRYFRHELNLSQRMLGIMLGVTELTIARWEKGESAISGPADRMIRILFGKKFGGNEAIKEFIECLTTLDDLIDGELRFEETKDGWQPAIKAA